ncbi:hypothetical protein CVT27_08005 [Streptomyces cavourensis]|nr:hypothetical protein CVT27_08005 [Streptomyces cavourensis]
MRGGPGWPGGYAAPGGAGWPGGYAAPRWPGGPWPGGRATPGGAGGPGAYAVAVSRGRRMCSPPRAAREIGLPEVVRCTDHGPS